MTRIIISRTDNIGDVVLTLVLAGILKKRLADCHISVLARQYVHDVVAASPYVDDFIDWDSLATLQDTELTERLRAYQADIFLHVFPNKRLACAAHAANIPLRVGSAHRWYQLIHCNKRLWFSRKRSPLHEALLNTKLLAPLALGDTFTTTEQLLPYIKLQAQADLPRTLQQQLDSYPQTVVIHPGSNGHTREWPSHYFQQLIERLAAQGFGVCLTGTTHEAERFAPLISATQQHAINLMGQVSLAQLITLLARCDGLVAGSTGPLHIAAALGTYTLGLFPPAGTMSPQRWAPLGRKAHYLVSQKTCPGCVVNSDCSCMLSISVTQVMQHIQQHIPLKESAIHDNA